MAAGLASIALVAALMAQETSATSATAPAKEFRRHFTAVTKKGAVLYQVTVITRPSDDEDKHFVLIEDSRGNDYLLTHDRSYFKQENAYEFRDLKRKTFVRTTYAYPYKARTRADSIAEARANPKVAQDVTLTVETSGAIRSAKESEWKDTESAREWTSEIRESLDPTFVEELERMRGGLFVGEPIMEGFCSVVVSLCPAWRRLPEF